MIEQRHRQAINALIDMFMRTWRPGIDGDDVEMITVLTAKISQAIRKMNEPAPMVA